MIEHSFWRTPPSGSHVERLVWLVVLVGVIMGLSSVAHAQDEPQVVLTGTVTEASTGTPLVGATVAVPDLSKGATTDDAGRYRLSIPPGRHTVAVSFVGYVTERRTLPLRADTTLNVALARETIDLDEVLVTGEADAVQSLNTGVETVEVQELEELPTFMGEVNIFRSLMQRPGVSSVGEGSAGFNVRGGDVGQNLVLFDGTPVFYPSHLFGFFSPFNSDVIADVTLYKGGVPASYGGRASAVLDVEQKTGHPTEYHGRGGVGPVTGRLMVEGPIVDGTTSFLVGTRLSYVNWLLDATGNEDLENSDAFFNDVNVGVTHRFGRQDELHVTGYRAFDDFVLADTTFNYTTQNVAVEWKHLFSDELVSRVKGTVADYGFEVRDAAPTNAFTLRNQVRSFDLSADLSWVPAETGHAVNAGASATYYDIDPATLRPDDPASPITAFAQPGEHGLETALYVSDDVTLTDRLKVRAGLRASMFNQFGPTTALAFENSAARTRATITDTLRTGRGSVAQTYWGLEPRLSVRYSLSDASSVKLSYNRMRQYLHLLSNTTAVSPVDVWHVSSRHRAPQIGDQVAAGYFRDLLDGRVQTSVEVFYKWLQDTVAFRSGADLLVNDALSTDLLQGIGRSYGLEVSLRKPGGRYSGSLNYTYSRAWRKVDGPAPAARINDGDWYPANFDRPHEVSAAFTYTGADPRVSWNFNWVYRSGRPITFPASKFVVDGIPVANFSNRNEVRIPDYHRLDLSLRLDLERREKRGWNASWTFSVFNVYGRKNPFSVFFGRKDGGSVPQAFQLSVFGTVFPSLTYTFEF